MLEVLGEDIVAEGHDVLNYEGSAFGRPADYGLVLGGLCNGWAYFEYLVGLVNEVGDRFGVDLT